jgi:thioredoxin reductase (NADPH)
MMLVSKMDIKKEYEIIILGVGPAGLQAAIHAARAKVSVLLMGKPENSSVYKTHIENYCCLDNITGDELLEQGLTQAKKYGADFLEEDCVETRRNGDRFEVRTEGGRELRARAIIFTLGVTRNTLNVPGEATLRGQGVSYCVECDANFFKNRPVAVIGDGSAAVSGALTLTSYTDTVHLISRTIRITRDLDKQLRESKVIIHDDRSVKKINGEGSVDSIELKDGTILDVEGVFIELGAKGALELAGFLDVELTDNFKHIKTNKSQETNIPGIYAAGDISGPPWQIAKAIGEGCIAGLEAAKYVKKFR